MNTIVGEIVDIDAIEIGELYEKAKSTVVDSLVYQWECGTRLIAKKTMMPKTFTAWQNQNAAVLGFDTPRTAQRLIKLAQRYTKTTLTSLSAPEAIRVGRSIWGNAHVANNSGENEWYTPPYIIDAARAVMGSIDLDPASSEIANQIVLAGEYFTKEDDGLNQEWFGNIWLNPPYAQPLIDRFSEVLAVKHEAGEFEQACVLVNNATETEWFQRLLKLSVSVCFLKGRVKFLDVGGNPEGAPLQGQAVLYCGGQPKKFRDEFSSMGICLRG